MHKLKYFMLVIIALCFSSCDNKQKIKLEGINFGPARYYDSFLFVPEKNEPATQKLEFSFNDWAKLNQSFVELSFINSDGNRIGMDDSKIKIYVNDRICKNGLIKLKPSNDSLIQIKFEFEPDSPEKEYYGYVVVNQNKIDRINNIENIKSNSKIFEWTAEFEIVMNPLKKGLLWFVMVVSAMLFIWFVVLKDTIYKKIKQGKLVLNSPYSKTIKIRGAKKVVFCNKKQKQTTLNKIFTGQIVYEINPFWQDEIVFTPKTKKSIRIKAGINYTITPYTNVFERGGNYQLQNKNKELIKITYL